MEFVARGKYLGEKVKVRFRNGTFICDDKELKENLISDYEFPVPNHIGNIYFKGETDKSAVMSCYTNLIDCKIDGAGEILGLSDSISGEIY